MKLIAFFLFLFLLATKVHSECPSLKEHVPRGISCLHCLFTGNTASVLGLTDALINSCNKKIGLAFVTDGSFGNEFDVIYQAYEKMLELKNRELFLHLYLVNGPAQRRWRKVEFHGFGLGISPQKFRSLIKKNKIYQQKYKDYLTTLLPVLDFSKQNEIKISISPVLEDNLDDASFRSILKLTKEVFGNYDIRYLRNPCSDCFAGNTAKVPKGVGKELHHIGKYLKTRNGIVSNDGWGYVYFNGEKKEEIKLPYRIKGREEKAVTLDEISNLADISEKLNNTFLLWIAKYQQTVSGNKNIAPELRKYPVPTAGELEEISEFIGR